MNFYSMMMRMKYINRWGLMRNNNIETLSAHSFDVAVLAHALAAIGKRRLNKPLDPQRAAVLALFHDAPEIITGDLPTPIKYHDEAITKAYKDIEKAAGDSLYNMLPDDIAQEYSDAFYEKEEDKYLWQLIKAADKLSALIKCIEEEKSGNTEFAVAKSTIAETISLCELDELKIFMDEFFEPFTKTLDELG